MKDFFLSIHIRSFIIFFSVSLLNAFHNEPLVLLPTLPKECLILLKEPRKFEDFLDLSSDESPFGKELVQEEYCQSEDGSLYLNKDKGLSDDEEWVQKTSIQKSSFKKRNSKKTKAQKRKTIEEDKDECKELIIQLPQESRFIFSKKNKVGNPITENIFKPNFSEEYLAACCKYFSVFSKNKEVQVALLYLMASDHLSYKPDYKGTQAASVYYDILCGGKVNIKEFIIFKKPSKYFLVVQFLAQALVASYIYQKPYPLKIKDQFPDMYPSLKKLNSSLLDDVYNSLLSIASSITGNDYPARLKNQWKDS